MHPLPYIIYHILPALSNTTASAPGVKGFKGSRIPPYHSDIFIEGVSYYDTGFK